MVKIEIRRKKQISTRDLNSFGPSPGCVLIWWSYLISASGSVVAGYHNLTCLSCAKINFLFCLKLIKSALSIIFSYAVTYFLKSLCFIFCFIYSLINFLRAECQTRPNKEKKCKKNCQKRHKNFQCGGFKMTSVRGCLGQHINLA